MGKLRATKIAANKKNFQVFFLNICGKIKSEANPTTDDIDIIMPIRLFEFRLFATAIGKIKDKILSAN